MNLKQLRYFSAVAEHGSITLAAASVRIAQSAVSSQIAALEAELGTPLLVRHGRGIALTDAGRVMLDHARRIDRAVLIAKREVKAAGEAVGEIALGIPVSMSSALTLPLMRAIEAAFPGSQVRIYEGLTGDLRAWLRSGKVETAILYGDDDAGGLELIPLAEDELVLFGAPFECAEATEVGFRFEHLARFPLFTTDEDHPVRPMLKKLAELHGIELNFAGRINSVHQLRELAKSGKGYTVLPKVALAAEITSLPSLIHHIRPPIHMLSYVASAGATDPRLCGIIRQVTTELVAMRTWPGANLL